MDNQIIKAFFSSNSSNSSSKTRNLKLIYRLISRQDSITADTIIEKTNIKPATCARLLDELAQNNLILTNKLGESTGGRKPILYQINPNIGYIIGIEITDIFSTILLMDMELSIIDKVKLKTSNVKIDQTLLDLVVIEVKALLVKNNLNIAQILGIGMSSDDLLSNLTTSDTEACIRFAKEYLHQRLPTYITFGSGTNFAAIAEHKLHYANTSQRFLFTRCDIEIHSSMIIDGTIPFTQANMTGAFGHTIIDVNGKACPCGSFGCVNQYSSFPAIKEKIIQQLKRGRPSMINDWLTSADEVDYHTIFKALEMQDILSVEVLEEAAYYYSVALFNFILAFQPDTVICGGALVPKSTFCDVIQKNIAEKIKAHPQLKTKVYPAVDSYDIVSQGAGGMVLERFLA